MFISFLGLGQVGSNLADVAASRGFHAASINYSQRDLDSLENIELKLKLVGSEGIGKIRSEAIRLMNNNWDLAINFVKENFSHSSIEIIFVPFATGGGSGAGIAPVLLSLLQETLPGKVFVAMPIIPDLSEAFTTQRNCLETFEDISDLNMCILPVDNDKAHSTKLNIGKNRLYEKVNTRVIEIIKRLVDYTDKESNYGVLDRKDLKNLFNVKGIASIAETNIATLEVVNNLNEKAVSNNIRQSWATSCFTDIEIKKVVSAGLIYDGQTEFMDYVNLTDLFSVFQNKMPLNMYEGYYKNNKDGRVITVLTGLNWCNSRLEMIDELLQSIATEFNGQSEEVKYQSKTIHIPTVTTKEPTKVNDISSLINKFKRQPK